MIRFISDAIIFLFLYFLICYFVIYLRTSLYVCESNNLYIGLVCVCYYLKCVVLICLVATRVKVSPLFLTTLVLAILNCIIIHIQNWHNYRCKYSGFTHPNMHHYDSPQLKRHKAIIATFILQVHTIIAW